MAKEKAPIKAEIASDPVEPRSQKPVKPKALDVAAPQVSSEVDGTVVPSRMPDSYLTVDPRMDSSPITVKFSAKEAPELVLEDIVDSSGQSGARKIAIPLAYLTTLMGFTALISYSGRSEGQAAVSQVKEAGMSFYPASESEDLAPWLFHEKSVHNTPTYDMKDHTGDEPVLLKVHPLAKAGDKVYCTAVTEQDATPYVFYTVIHDHVLSEEEAVAGHVLRFSIARGWLARRKQWRSLTLQSAWITSGLAAEPPADVDPHLETRLPRNALEIQRRRTAALIVDHRIDTSPPQLRQSALYNGEWWLNPGLAENGGNVDAPDLDTYASDRICFSLSGPGYGSKPLGCVTIENDGELASVELSPCDIACFFNKKLTLNYTLEFPNGEGPQHSPEQVVNVLVPQFPHSEIEQATRNTLDLSTFSGDATAWVPVWSYAECSTCCWMWITGKHEDGSACKFDLLMDASVTDAWKEHGVDVPIQRAMLTMLADCSEFELHFAASFCDACDLANAHTFPAHIFTIEQEPLVLSDPKVLQAVGSDLTAYNGRDGVDVQVDYVGNNARHSISVCWKRPNGACWSLASKPGSATGPVLFSLPPEAVIESMGNTVEITYTVISACKEQTSLPWNLNISRPVRLPTPEVPQATPPATQKGILDLRTFVGNAEVVLPKWWFMLPGQRGWLTCTGTHEDGSPYTINVMESELITAEDVTKGLSRVLLRSELANYQRTAELTFEFKVTPDGSTEAREAIVFPRLTLIFLKRLIDETGFDPAREDWNNWQKGAGATDARDLRRDYGAYPWGMGYWLNNWGWTNTSDPVTQREILFKIFTVLEPGHIYQFSAWVRDDNNVPNKPLLALTASGVDITPVVAPDTTWRLLMGTFTATSSTVRLSVDNRRMGMGPGNDFRVTWLRLYEV